jgi:molybdenum cofactor biosynthesis enzyme MoaA
MLEIQSLSVCVPTGCPNKCKFCVSRMHNSPYIDQIKSNLAFYDLYERDFCKRLQFARDNGCNTAILTGEGEPLLDKNYLKMFSHWNESISDPFRWIEVQTSGVTLDDDMLRFIRNTVGVTSISLSLSDMFDDDSNQEMNGTPDNMKVVIKHLCAEIKRYDFNLRLSLNMTDAYEKRFHLRLDCVEQLFKRAKELGADMVTFRQLYLSGDPSLEQNKWIESHRASQNLMTSIDETIKGRGRVLERLPFGVLRYSLDGMSLVVDDDCMATHETKAAMKYLVLRPNCKLYTRWDDEGSILF